MPAFLISDGDEFGEIVFSDTEDNAFAKWIEGRCASDPCPEDDCYCRDSFHAEAFPDFDQYEAEGVIPHEAYAAHPFWELRDDND